MIKLFKMLSHYLLLGIIILKCSGSVQMSEYNYAVEAYSQGKYQTAITYIDKAIKVERTNCAYYVLRAKSNYRVGNKDLAMDDLNTSLSIEPNFDAFHLRGKLFLERNELENAKKDFRDAYELNSESADLLFDLGYLEYLNNENQLALEYYIKASEFDSRNPATYVNIGNLYSMMGSSKLAIDNYSKALVLDTTDGIAYYNRANEKMILGDFNGAIEDYENSLSIDSINISTLFILAEVKTKIKDYSGALNNYSTIIRLDSTSAKAFYLRGTTEIDLETYEKACIDFKNAGDLGYFDAYEMIKKYCEPKKKTEKKKNKKKSKS